MAHFFGVERRRGDADRIRRSFHSVQAFPHSQGKATWPEPVNPQPGHHPSRACLLTQAAPRGRKKRRIAKVMRSKVLVSGLVVSRLYCNPALISDPDRAVSMTALNPFRRRRRRYAGGKPSTALRWWTSAPAHHRAWWCWNILPAASSSGRRAVAAWSISEKSSLALPRHEYCPGSIAANLSVLHIDSPEQGGGASLPPTRMHHYCVAVGFLQQRHKDGRRASIALSFGGVAAPAAATTSPWLRFPSDAIGSAGERTSASPVPSGVRLQAQVPALWRLGARNCTGRGNEHRDRPTGSPHKASTPSDLFRLCVA